MEVISAKDRKILRSLAEKQATLAHSEPMKALIQDWEAAGAFSSDARAMIRIELDTFEQDIVPALMRCEGNQARQIERMLHSNMVNHELFGDDTLVRDHIAVPIRTTFIPFGLPVQRQMGSGNLGHHFVSQIFSLEEDMDKLGPSTIEIDLSGTQAKVDFLSEIIGDILPVRMENSAMDAVPMQDIIHIMDMEDMYVALLDEPELFHKMLDMLTDDYINMFEQMECLGILNATARDEHLYQGTYCFTDDLPSFGQGMKLKELWLHMDSQETAGISPAMFNELVFPHYKKVADRFGLLSYGCCEAVHDIWEGGIAQFENLRKVSISPWCNEKMMGERLRGKKVVFQRKPAATMLGVGRDLDEQAVITSIRATAEASRGCLLEISQRDVYQINGTSDKVHRYVQLIRETIDRYWHR